jgi:6,7-dimethyl-8-ribityllumazine synthase
LATFEGRFTEAASLKVGVVVARFNDLVTAKLLSGSRNIYSPDWNHRRLRLIKFQFGASVARNS